MGINTKELWRKLGYTKTNVYLCFDLPDTLPQYFITSFSEFPYTHVRVFVENKSLRDFLNFELTYDGWYYKRFSVPFYKLEYPKLDNVLIINWEVDEEEYEDIVCRISELISYYSDCKWSYKYVWHYLRHGHFPSYTCASALGYVLFDNSSLDTPSKLYQYTLNNERRLHLSN